MTIPPRFLDEIRNRLTLSEVIGRRTRVIRAGREFKACCPFHKEKTPSFTINDDKQFYHCFGCGAHGDVIGFVMRHDNLSFIDAVEALSAQAGLQMPRPDPESIKKAERARDLHTLMDKATSWFTDQLFARQNEKILEYVENRGLQRDVIEAFRLGFAPADMQALRKFLKAEGFEDQAMIEVGILKKSDRGEPYSFFRERVMFPVSDRRGRVVAFGGRVLPDHMRAPDREGFKPPKYINSTETPLFDKGRMLYGESLARQAARDGQTVLVAEGYMDVIACHQAGFNGAVAPMGTALTEEQIMSLWSMIVEDEKNPVLCFDGDEAGRRAASRACERILPLLKPNHSARFAFMPDGEDPDSLLRSGGSPALEKVISSALSLFDFIWLTHTAGRKFETPESRAGLSKVLQDQIKVIPDRDVQRHYQELVRARISENFFKPFGKQSQPGKPAGPGALKPRRPVFQSANIYQRALVAAVLNHPSIYEGISEQFGQFELSNKGLGALRQEIIKALEKDPELDNETLYNHLNACGFKQEMDDILNESVYVHATFCAPGADSAHAGAHWLEIWQGLEGRNLQKEIRQGWKQAFHQSSEEDEEKLKAMLQIRASDGR